MTAIHITETKYKSTEKRNLQGTRRFTCNKITIFFPYQLYTRLGRRTQKSLFSSFPDQPEMVKLLLQEII